MKKDSLLSLAIILLLTAIVWSLVHSLVIGAFISYAWNGIIVDLCDFKQMSYEQACIIAWFIYITCNLIIRSAKESK